ncbi:MAG: LysM peptidoglycan-binding domain-containing protein [Nitrospiraceae bacterium]
MSINRVLGFIIAFLACLPLSAGCSSDGSASRILAATNARTQADTVVQDTQAELAALRRDLAAARIATSKQEGEAAELRRTNTLREADRAELRQMLAQAHSAVNTLQTERDALKQALAQTQTVSLVRQTSSASTKQEETDIQGDVTELKARMRLLTDELAQLTKHFLNKVRPTSVISNRESAAHPAEASPEPVLRDEPAQPRIVPSVAFLAPSAPVPSPGQASGRSPQQGLIRVHPGDSLWKLAHKHATTIEELKRINGLTCDVVHAGQRLILP